MITGVIFDVDGTLLDSMDVWEKAPFQYLQNRGVFPEKNLGKTLFSMTMEQGALYIKEKYHLKESVQEIIQGVNEAAETFYAKEVPLKSGMRKLLETLKSAGIPVAAATTSSRPLVETAFLRLGIRSYFQAIFTASEVGKGKEEPDIYYLAAKALGSPKETTAVFEDGLYAAKTAAKAGFFVVGVYDRCSEKDQETLKKTAALYLGKEEDPQKFWDEIRRHKMKTALTIAGSDCSGGAGIQADIKTMTAHRVYAMSAITALTAQNTTGVAGIMEVAPEFLEEQLDAVFTDIYPDAVKIGMVSSGELIRAIAKKLRQYQAKNIVIDPVMVSTSGSPLISKEAISVLKEELLPLATVLTPNIPEGEILSGMCIKTQEDMEKAARTMCETFQCAVLLKGGHQLNDANDFLCWKEGSLWFYGERIENPNTHGTGCTLSSAIASNLAKGKSLEDAVGEAKAYISGALKDMLDLGKGSGPMNHAFGVKGEYAANNIAKV